MSKSKRASNAIFKYFPNELCVLFWKKAFEWINILIGALMLVQLDRKNTEKNSSNADYPLMYLYNYNHSL